MKLLKSKNVRIGSVYLIANMINKAIAFITIPIFSRILTTGEYGTVSTYTSYVMILQYFMGLSSEYTVRNAYVDYREEIPQYMSSMFMLSCLCSGVVSIVVILINCFIIHISTPIMCICCLIHSFMTYINNAMSMKLMMDNNYLKRALFMAAPNLLSAILGIILIIMLPNDRVMGRVWGYVIAISIFGVISMIGTWKKSEFKASKKYWKYILKISPPLIIHGLSIIALSQFDRIMITAMRSPAETGMYSIIYSLSMIAMAVTSAIEGIWTPWFTEKYTNKEYSVINKKAQQYLFLASFMMADIILVSPEVLKFMTPEAYWGGVNMIPPLVVSSYFIYMYSFFINLELYEKTTKIIAISTFVSAIINIILNYMFIPQYGAIAASITTLISYVLSFGFHCLHCKTINRNLFTLSSFAKPMIILLLMIPIFYYYIDIAWIRWGVAISIAILPILKFYVLLFKRSDMNE